MKKRLFSALLALALCLGLAVPAMGADLSYELPEGGTIWYNPSSGYIHRAEENSITVFITPREIDGFKITAFETQALAGQRRMTTAIIHDNITTISDGLFLNCSNLKVVYISDSIKKIDFHAFEGCGKLADVYYGGSALDWGDLWVCAYNDPLDTAAKHFNSRPEDVLALIADTDPTPTPTPTPSATPAPVDTPPPSAAPTHVHELTHYAAKAATCTEGGNLEGTFSPSTYITRAESAAIVSRMAESNNRVSFSL